MYYDVINLIQDNELKSLLKEVSIAYKKVENKPLSIGVMGKSGAGKSSFINALCQDSVCDVGHSSGCTRNVKKIQLKLGEINLLCHDFPGIAENQKWDKQYIELYQSYFDKLDLIFWTIKLDDRALFADQAFFNEHVSSSHEIYEKTIFLLTQADKAEPTREWDNYSYQPSTKQKDIIERKRYRIFTDFNIDGTKIIDISVGEKYQIYNFDRIFSLILYKISNIPEVNDELDFKTSWAITKREGNEAQSHVSTFATYTKESLDDLLKELEELL